MRADSGRWTEVVPSQFPHEREGLHHVREHLPETEPYRAWSNFTFTTKDGKTPEVDLLVLGPAGLHLVELKAWSGRISGDEYAWVEHNPSAHRPKQRTSPIRATNDKAKWLREWLEQAAKRHRRQVPIPFVQESVLLHGTEVDARGLPENVRSVVFGREDGTSKGLRRIVADRLTAPPRKAAWAVDASQRKALEGLMELIGLKPRPRTVKVGQWVIDGDPIASGWGWVDEPAHHTTFTDDRARVRRWFVPEGAGAQDVEVVRAAAEREYRLLQGLDHPGLVGPMEYHEVDHGVAGLVYRDLDGRDDLDAWVSSHPDAPLELRLDVVRQVSEVMRYAHDHGLAHRGLGPRSVTVSERGARIDVGIRDWQSAGQVEAGSTGTTHHAQALAGHARDADQVYAAPEVGRGLRVDRRQSDVFSVGALAYLVLSGRAPATDAERLHGRLEADGGLMLSADIDSVVPSLEDLVWSATQAQVHERPAGMAAVLADLDDVLDELTAPEVDSVVLDPLEASPGDMLEGGYVVRRRLGEGSTSVALLVSLGNGPDLVLKVARDDAKAERVREEAASLGKVPSTRHFAALINGPVTVGGRTCLLVQQAGDRSLADAIAQHGRLNLDQLQRWGRDLLEAVAALEQAGLAHRDIKPANLGVRTESDGKPHLVLFDFSLASVPTSEVLAGTPGYRDPFLGPPDRRRLDPAAELFSVAVTLHEMAAARLPQWGDGRTDPSLLDSEVVLEPRLFDASVADGMVAFFAQALARKAEDRFDNAADMAAAWERVLAAADDSDAGDDDARAAGADLETPLEDAGLSSRALSALERYQLVTVGDLLDLPALELSRIPGAAQPVKDEIRARAVAWRERLRSTDAPTTSSVDAVVQAVVEKAANGPNPRVVALLLGLPDPDSGVALGALPSNADVADEADVTVDVVRETWEALPSTARRPLAPVVDDIATDLQSLGEIATLDELATRLVRRRGSHAPEPRRTAQALALTRLGLSAMAADELVVVRRRRDVILAVGTTAWDEPDEILAEALDLGEAAETLASTDPLPSSRTCVEAVRLRTTGELGSLGDIRLLEVAAATSGTAAVSSRGEVYPVGLTAVKAVALCAPSLVTGGRAVSAQTIQARVNARFPRASALPGPAQLQQLLEAAGVDLVWRDGHFEPRTVSTTYTNMASSSSHAWSSATDHEIEGLFEASLRERSFLALAVPIRHLEAAKRKLVETYSVRVVDLSTHVVRALRQDAERTGGDWQFVLRVDALPEGAPERAQLAVIVRHAATWILGDVSAMGEPVLLTGAEILGRHGCVDLLGPVADLASKRPAARWLLAAQSTSAGTDLDGHPVPVAAPTQWLHLPAAWAHLRPTLERGTA